QASMWTRISSASAASTAPSTQAATEPWISSCSGIDQPSSLQIGAELLEREPHSSLDRAERHVRQARDLRLRVAAVVRQRHRLPLLGRKAAQGLAHRTPLERQRDLAPRVGAGSRRDELRLQLQLLPLMPASAAEVVDGAVADRGDQPGAEGSSARVERRGPLPHVQEGVLYGVFRAPGVAENAQRD